MNCLRKCGRQMALVSAALVIAGCGGGGSTTNTQNWQNTGPADGSNVNTGQPINVAGTTDAVALATNGCSLFSNTEQKLVGTPITLTSNGVGANFTPSQAIYPPLLGLMKLMCGTPPGSYPNGTVTQFDSVEITVKPAYN